MVSCSKNTVLGTDREGGVKQEAQYQDVIGLILPGYHADPPHFDPKSLFEQRRQKKRSRALLGNK